MRAFCRFAFKVGSPHITSPTGTSASCSALTVATSIEQGMFNVAVLVVANDLGFVQQQREPRVPGLQGRLRDVEQDLGELGLAVGSSGQAKGDVLDRHRECTTADRDRVDSLAADLARERHPSFGGLGQGGDEGGQLLLGVVSRLELLAHSGPAVAASDGLQLLEEHGLADAAESGQSQVGRQLGRAGEDLLVPVDLRVAPSEVKWGCGGVRTIRIPCR